MPAKDKILIVEDEKGILSFMTTVLSSNGYDVISANSGAKAITMVTSHCPDLVILDLGLPDMDGVEVLRFIREWTHLPIIVVSARTHERDKVEALDLGADDYVTKPFDPIEVQARVRSQLRRYTRLGGQQKREQPKDTITIGGVELNDAEKSVTVDGEPVQLTPIEYNILHLLMRNPNRVFSSTQIYELVWNENAYGSESAVAVHIRHLREKIEINPSEPRYIKVVWGQGYKMEGKK